MNENTIRYEAQITDPATFTRPWNISMLIYRRAWARMPGCSSLSVSSSLKN